MTYGTINDAQTMRGGAEGALLANRYRVARGGSWYYFARSCRFANRAGSEPGYRGNNLGFRVALAPRH